MREREGARYAVDATGRVVSCNEAFADLVGRRVGEIVGKPSLLFYPPEAAPQLLRSRIESLLGGGASRPLSVRMLRAHGEPVLVELRVTRLDQGGQFSGHLVEVRRLEL